MAKNRDVMTKDPVFCEPGDSITKVARIMKREDVGSVPVVESAESRKLLGIITDRDIVVKIVAEGLAPDGPTVTEAMTPNPASCREDDDVEYAVKLMKERQVRRMPIADSAGRHHRAGRRGNPCQQGQQDWRAGRSDIGVRDGPPLRRPSPGLPHPFDLAQGCPEHPRRAIAAS
jgi:CBS domain-containing protein